MSDRRWPSFAEIETMESTEAYDLYWNLPATTGDEQIAIIRALGDKAWAMRQEEDAGKAKRTFLPMPEKAPDQAAPMPPKRPPFYAPKKKPVAHEERPSGASIFLAGLKL
jgi:hypothetical protein